MGLGASIQVYTFGAANVTLLRSLFVGFSTYLHYKAENCLLDFYNHQCQYFHLVIPLSQFKHDPGNYSIYRAMVR